MKLLFVIDSLGPGGAQRQVVELATTLARRGHATELFIYWPQHDHFLPVLQAAGVPVHTEPKRSKFSTNVIPALRRLVAAGGYDAVISFLTVPNLYAELALAGMRRRPRLFVSERSAWAEPLPPRTRLLQYAHRLADRLVINSQHQYERTCRTMPWLGARAVTILNGVDTERYRPADSPGEPRADNRLRLLTVARLGPEKNPLLVLDALALYRDRHGPPPIVDWAGDHVDPDYAARVAAHAQRLGLEDAFRRLGVRSDVASLMHEYDALLHPSLYEGTSNAVCEALASGLPVLVSDVCDHRWLSADGQAGLVFDPGSADAICQALRSFAVTSEEDRAAMRRAARDFAERELSIERAADAYERLLAEP